MLFPTMKAASLITKNKRIGVIATEATIKSDAHKTLFKEHASDIEVFTCATPELVPFIENQKTDSPECFTYLNTLLKTLLEKNIDTLILGCTHYPFIEHVIKKIAPQLHIISAAGCIAPGNSSDKKELTFFVSGNEKEFEKKIESFLQLKNPHIISFI